MKEKIIVGTVGILVLYIIVFAIMLKRVLVKEKIKKQNGK
jgi:hypothetical protein